MSLFKFGFSHKKRFTDRPNEECGGEIETVNTKLRRYDSEDEMAEESKAGRPKCE